MLQFVNHKVFEHAMSLAPRWLPGEYCHLCDPNVWMVNIF